VSTSVDGKDRLDHLDPLDCECPFPDRVIRTVERRTVPVIARRIVRLCQLSSTRQTTVGRPPDGVRTGNEAGTTKARDPGGVR
jgi:hypothetical protein